MIDPKKLDQKQKKLYNETVKEAMSLEKSSKFAEALKIYQKCYDTICQNPKIFQKIQSITSSLKEQELEDKENKKSNPSKKTTKNAPLSKPNPSKRAAPSKSSKKVATKYDSEEDSADEIFSKMKDLTLGNDDL